MLGCASTSISTLVQALEGDVFRPYLRAAYSYDDNLRKFDSKEQALLSTGSRNTADTFTSSTAGIILDKQISRQSLYADFSLTKTKYDRNTFLNNDGKRFLLRWNWRFGNYWHGKVEAFHQESMVPFGNFNDPRTATLNVLTQKYKQFEAVRDLHPRWIARAAVGKSEFEYTTVGSADLSEYTQEAEIDYITPSRSKVGLVYRHARGDRPVPQRVGLLDVDNSYDENSLKANIEWIYSKQTRLQFLGGFVRREHDEFSQRDFRGFNARANAQWAVTGKTSLNASMWREANASSFVTASYTLNKGANISGLWDVSNKVGMQANYQYEIIDFVGDDFAVNADREDKRQTATVSLTYRPTLSLRINTYLNRSTRDSSRANSDFKSNGMGISAQYEF